MDMDDNFKTIGSQSGKPSKGLDNPICNSGRAPHWYLQQARMIVGCYRRDEAHDPEVFAAALALILADYAPDVVAYAADPRTGVLTEFPHGLPNVGQIREFLDAVRQRKARLSDPEPVKKIARPVVPPKLQPGQFTYAEFLEMAARGEVKPRPLGRFEKA